MAVYTFVESEDIDFVETDDGDNAMYTPYYGTVALANSYFQYKLDKDSWDNATLEEKKSSLVEAARAIDRLNFVGDKADEEQELEFPRDDDTEVPKQITFAAYEIALKLLDGVRPETERENLSSTSQGFGQIRVNYDRGFVPLHFVNGIASSVAWNFLLPYLRDSNEVKIRRG